MQVRTGYHRWSSLVDSKCTSLIRWTCFDKLMQI
jgi:hypothetical protein